MDCVYYGVDGPWDGRTDRAPCEEERACKGSVLRSSTQSQWVQVLYVGVRTRARRHRTVVLSLNTSIFSARRLLPAGSRGAEMTPCARSLEVQ